MLKYLTSGKIVAFGSVLIACALVAGIFYGVMHPKLAQKPNQQTEVLTTESPPEDKPKQQESNPFENQYRLPSSTPGG
ncbi:MAG: hypothetical protein JST89_12255 [Cyanobacteria bacterium SZAS-4]|nr:hypothetical protein [Cyanobacteria bacterium SZAS-4]